MKRYAFAITLVLVLMGSAIGQTKRTIPSPINLWEGYSLNIPKVNGVEVSAGTLDYVDSICWGRTFSMTGESVTFTIAPNYSFDRIILDSTQYYSKITGGSWTMVYNDGKSSGMLFGELTGGNIEWYMNKSGNLLSGEIAGEMIITGGTGSFENLGGPSTYGKFTGVVDYDKKGVPFIVGTVDLMF